MIIIKEKEAGSTRESLDFAKKYWNILGEIKYVLLSNADGNKFLSLDSRFYNWYTVVLFGEEAQVWFGGLTWGYDGEGPYGLFRIMREIDPFVTYDQIKKLERIPKTPIVFENVEGRLTQTSTLNINSLQTTCVFVGNTCPRCEVKIAGVNAKSCPNCGLPIPFLKTQEIGDKTIKEGISS